VLKPKKCHVIAMLNNTRGCIQKFPNCVDNEINDDDDDNNNNINNNKHSLRSKTKCYGGKSH